MDLDIQIQTTPNPDALKFILNKEVKAEGKASFSSPEECFDNVLARDLLQIKGVTQVHFFENVITVSKGEGDWTELEPQIRSIIETRMPVHNPHFLGKVDESERRKGLSPELLQIEEILDRQIRPGLQGDGGDIEILKLDGKTLYVRYQGACGSCPSSTTGTLMAIEDILRQEYLPDLEVVSV